MLIALTLEGSGPDGVGDFLTSREGQQLKGPVAFQGLEVMANALPLSPENTQAAVTLQTPIAEGPLKERTFGGVLTVAIMGAMTQTSADSAAAASLIAFS